MSSETQTRSTALLVSGTATAPYPGAQCCTFPKLLGLKPRTQCVTSSLMKM